MKKFNVPTRAEVSPANQEIFDALEKGLSFVPNLYAYYGKNETALADYLGFQDRKTTLSKKEKEAINLVVSEHNGCTYCQAAHTKLGELNGFSQDEIIELRTGTAKFNDKLNVLATFTKAVVAKNGKVTDTEKENFIAAGYTEANVIDVVIAIGTKSISNYIHNIAQFEIDFPLAPTLETVNA